LNKVEHDTRQSLGYGTDKHTYNTKGKYKKQKQIKANKYKL